MGTQQGRLVGVIYLYLLTEYNEKNGIKYYC